MPLRANLTYLFVINLSMIFAIIKIITKDGNTTATVAVSEPITGIMIFKIGLPKSTPANNSWPIKVAMLITIGPGVDSDTVTKFWNGCHTSGSQGKSFSLGLEAQTDENMVRKLSVVN